MFNLVSRNVAFFMWIRNLMLQLFYVTLHIWFWTNSGGFKWVQLKSSWAWTDASGPTQVPRIYDFLIFFDVKVLFWELKVETQNFSASGISFFFLFGRWQRFWALRWSFFPIGTRHPRHRNSAVSWKTYEQPQGAFIKGDTYIQFFVEL